jgi:hypothetical protein
MKLLYEEFTDIVTYVIRFVMKHSYLFEINNNNNYWVLNFYLTQYYKIKKGIHRYILMYLKIILV